VDSNCSFSIVTCPFSLLISPSEDSDVAVITPYAFVSSFLLSWFEKKIRTTKQENKKKELLPYVLYIFAGHFAA